MEPSAPWRAIERLPSEPAPAERDRAPERPQVAALVSVGVAVLFAAGAFVVSVTGGDPSVDVVAAESGTPAGPSGSPSAGRGDELVVEVAGAVLRPGVHRVPLGSRIGDLIEAAGGYGPRVDTARAERELNLAARLEDGQRVVVPSRDEPPSSGAPRGSAPGGTAGGPVDLNHASAEELDTLPGIGPATAAKIIAARDEQPFASVDDLRTRKVVGPATFDKLKDLVTVR